MSAQTTRTSTSIEVQPYTTDLTDGRVYCGACRPPVVGTHVQHIDQRRRVWDVPEGRDMDESEYRSTTLLSVTRCDGCGAHPADFPRFDLHGTATVEHVTCRIF